MNAKDRISELTQQLNHYNQQYYQNSISEVDDYTFDKLLEELVQLETDNPTLKLPDSPSQRVGGTITKEFETVIHKYPMLSLGNTYSEQELLDFDERVNKGLMGREYEYICELKFDGVALSMTYENGLLVRGVTRGDGTKGDNITANVKTIRTLPLRINKENIPTSFEVRGEGFMPYSVFKRINDEKEELGEQLLANPRNAASGTFKQQDSAAVAERNLDCYIYSYLSDNQDFNTHEESLVTLSDWGFNISKTWRKCSNIQKCFEFINEWETKRHELPLNTDGIVIKINSYEQQEELGFTAKSPRWAIAFKYKSENKSTLLKKISYQVGRTGAITPVAELQPVSLAGTMVKRASLHNANEIERIGIHEGDWVCVEKGGEIIPKITSVDLTKRLDNSLPVTYITNCPECGTLLVRTEGEAQHYCPNDKGCPPQIKGRLEHFIHRKAMNIDSLGEGKIELLFDKKLVTNPADLYDLKYEDLFGIEKTIIDEETGKSKKIGFKEKTVENILKALEQSKNIPFKSVLFAIGIRFVGATVAEKLANHFKTVDSLAIATKEELLSVAEIGERIAQSVLDFFADSENVAIIHRLKVAGLQFSSIDEEFVQESNLLAGKSFLYTGTFVNFGREDLEAKIEANGGRFVSGVSSKLDYLIVGEKAGASKLDKANKLGVKMISEEEFVQMLS
ncbi:MAG: NAD-dependent DNA ligase LigA [Bacteroidota bacterium]